jgi:hypothetical protein
MFVGGFGKTWAAAEAVTGMMKSVQLGQLD